MQSAVMGHILMELVVTVIKKAVQHVTKRNVLCVIFLKDFIFIIFQMKLKKQYVGNVMFLNLSTLLLIIV